jgi:glutathione S-transferase
MPRIPRTMLRPSSIDYFHAARSARFGMTLDELEARRGGEKAWEAAKPGLNALEALMGEHKVDEGPFVLGSRVSYADFVIVAVLEGFRRLGQDLFDRVVEGREGLRGVWEACGEWMGKDD